VRHRRFPVPPGPRDQSALQDQEPRDPPGLSDPPDLAVDQPDPQDLSDLLAASAALDLRVPRAPRDPSGRPVLKEARGPQVLPEPQALPALRVPLELQGLRELMARRAPQDLRALRVV
jgi:hypothetical protein